MISNNDTMYDDEIPDNIQPELNAKLNHRNCFAFSNTDGGNGLMDDDDSHVFADDDDDDDDYNSNAIYRICSSDVCKSNNRHRQQNCGLQRSSIEEYVDRTFNHNEHQSTNAFDDINDNDMKDGWKNVYVFYIDQQQQHNYYSFAIIGPEILIPNNNQTIRKQKKTMPKCNRAKHSTIFSCFFCHCCCCCCCSFVG